MRTATVTLLGPLLLSLSGCGAFWSNEKLAGLVTPYRIDIVQGNVVTQEQIAPLKPGMSRQQVRDVLGTPLLTDPFHADRWDYLFTIRRPGTPPQRRSVVIRFENDAVKTIDAPDLPSEREFVASIAPGREPKPVKLELTDEERKALPAPQRGAAAPEATEAPLGPARDYPPLEPPAS
jgi:outer membrane protein assembly factor BamE